MQTRRSKKGAEERNKLRAEKKPLAPPDPTEDYEEMPVLVHADMEEQVNAWEERQLKMNGVLERILKRNFTFVIRGDNLECNICKKIMTGQTKKELTRHIAEDHLDDLDGPTVAMNPSKNYRFCKKMFDEEPTELDNAVCKFLTKFGLPASVVRDVTFTNLVTILSKTRSLPNPSAIELFVRKNAEREKRVATEKDIKEPLTITIDVVKQRNEVYLAYSAHFYDNNFTRKNSVFLRKLPSVDLNPVEILSEVRKSVSGRSLKTNFSNIVVTNSIIEKAFFKTGCINNSYICYYSIIQNYAEELIRHPQFSGGLETLKNFFHNVRATSGLFAKLQRFFVGARTPFDLPHMDLSKWTGTTDFLSDTLHLHTYFQDFNQKNRIKNYISDEVHANLCYLELILGQLQASVKKLSRPEAVISQIVPEVMELKKFITGNFTPDIRECFMVAFDMYLEPLVTHYREGVYDMATFLDPRFAYNTEIYPLIQWERIRSALKIELAKTNNYKLHVEMNAAKIEAELELYKETVKATRMGSVLNLLEWWKSQPEMPLLFTKAIIVHCAPPCTIDAEHFFGKRGKLNHLSGMLPLKKYNQWLVLSGSEQGFRGRGWPENELMKMDPLTVEIASTVTMPVRLAQPSYVSQKTGMMTPAAKRSKLMPLLDEQEPLEPHREGMYDNDYNDYGDSFNSPIDNEAGPSSSNSDVVVKNEPMDEDEAFESMLMQPPPGKQTSLGKKKPSTLDKIVKPEESNNVTVKQDIDDDADYYAGQGSSSYQDDGATSSETKTFSAGRLASNQASPSTVSKGTSNSGSTSTQRVNFADAAFAPDHSRYPNALQNSASRPKVYQSRNYEPRVRVQYPYGIPVSIRSSPIITQPIAYQKPSRQTRINERAAGTMLYETHVMAGGLPIRRDSSHGFAVTTVANHAVNIRNPMLKTPYSPYNEIPWDELEPPEGN